jgi:hypothetical protein
MRLRVASCAAFFALYGGSASAQVRTPPPAPARSSAAPAEMRDRIRLMGDVGGQATSLSFEETTTFQQYFEQGSLTVERTIPRQVFFDGGVAVRLTHRIYAGVSVSSFTTNGSGSVNANVPHPLLFNQPRSVTGTLPGIDRRETGIHIQAIWTTPVTRRIDVSLFGGPSFIQAEQIFATNASVSLAAETYPFDTLPFSALSLTTAHDTETIVGFNAGGDLTWRFFTTRPKNPRARPHSVGLGALIRYSHGSKKFNPAGGQITEVEAGGLQAGGGLRVIF